MAATIATRPADAESLVDIARRLQALLEQAEDSSASGQLPESVRVRLADITEALRRKLSRKADRDPRSLFDIDEHLAELMGRAEEAASESGEIPHCLVQEITEYLEAFRSKVDRIAGYLQWQESIAGICAEEAERLTARRRAAENRVERLKGMLTSFMLSRCLKKIEGDKSSIGVQQNSTPSLLVDDPLQIGECFRENAVRLTMTELREIITQLRDGDLKQRLEANLESDGWQINGSAVRAAITNGRPVTGARLVKGHHLRVR